MIKQLTIIIIMGLFSFLFCCKNNNNNVKKINKFDDIELEDITSRLDQAEGWYDIFLKITSDIKTDTSHIYIAKGLYSNKIVGIQIEINSNIGAGIVNGEIDVKSGIAYNAVRFRSLGQESDEFIKALAELYDQNSEKGFTKQMVSANVFSLNEKSVDLDKIDYYKLKLFFEEDDEDLYSEIYLNVNTKTQEIEIHEKDEDYREPIIKIWTK